MRELRAQSACSGAGSGTQRRTHLRVVDCLAVCVRARVVACARKRHRTKRQVKKNSEASRGRQRTHDSQYAAKRARAARQLAPAARRCRRRTCACVIRCANVTPRPLSELCCHGECCHGHAERLGRTSCAAPRALL
jgi:hypothetical protein